jgi:hypothetical protein
MGARSTHAGAFAGARGGLGSVAVGIIDAAAADAGPGRPV